MQFSLGDKVRKVNGYNWPGTVVAVFTALNGEPRVAVEFGDGSLKIYPPEQVEKSE